MWKFLVGSLLLQSLLLAQMQISEKSGKALFKTCAACHGSFGEKSALGKSIVINTLTKEDIITTIKGYQNGTYGRSMRALMKGQVIGLQNTEIEKIATYISKMNPNKKSLPVTTMTLPKSSSKPLVSVSKKETVVKLKVKPKRYVNGVTKVKFMVVHEMDTPKRARLLKIEPRYITKFLFKENNAIVYELDSTPYLARNPMCKFSYMSRGGDKLHIEVLNNRGETFQKDVNFRDSSIEKTLALVTKPVKNRTEIARNHPAIYAYLGKVSLIPTDKISLVSPVVASNGGSVPVAIRSDIKAKRVILFATEEDDKTQRVAEWKMHSQSIIDLQVRIKMDMIEWKGVISVVIEGEDGWFYLTEVRTDVALGGVEG